MKQVLGVSPLASAATPEPSSLLLMATGLAAFGAHYTMRKRQQA